VGGEEMGSDMARDFAGLAEEEDCTYFGWGCGGENEGHES